MNHAPAEFFHLAGKNLPVFREGAQGGFLIRAHETGIAHHVGAEDGGEFALDVG